MKSRFFPKIMVLLSIIAFLTPATLFAQDSYTEIDYPAIVVDGPSQSGTLSTEVQFNSEDDDVRAATGYSFSATAGQTYKITAIYTGDELKLPGFFLLKSGNLGGHLYGEESDAISFRGREGAGWDAVTLTDYYKSPITGSFKILLYDLYGNSEYTITVEAVEDVFSYDETDYANIEIGDQPQDGTLKPIRIVYYYETEFRPGHGYKFAIEEGKTYRIAISNTEAAYFGLNFFNPGTLSGDWDEDFYDSYYISSEDGYYFDLAANYTGEMRFLLTGYNNASYAISVTPAPMTVTEFLNNTTETIEYESNLEFTAGGKMLDIINDVDFSGDEENYYAVAYKITLSEGDFIKIHASKQGDSYLSIYKADGDGGYEWTEIDVDERNDGDEYLDFTADEDGEYYIVISDYYPDVAGNYYLTVWNTEEEPENPDEGSVPIIAKVQKASTLKAFAQNGNLQLSGLTAGKAWGIYSAKGALVQQGIANSSEMNVKLNMTKGVYFVRSNGQTLRIVNK